MSAQSRDCEIHFLMSSQFPLSRQFTFFEFISIGRFTLQALLSRCTQELLCERGVICLHVVFMNPPAYYKPKESSMEAQGIPSL